MNATWLILLSVGLCFDTLAVSVSIGINDQKVYFWQAFKIAAVFAFFQGLMPFLGWMGGFALQQVIKQFDHWIALCLLSFVGLRMIIQAFSKNEEKKISVKNIRLIIVLAIATSIDAFAVGITLGFTQVNIWIAAPVIGFFTGLTAMIGMLIGKKTARVFGKHIEIVGGLILIALGVKIILEHTGRF